MRGVLETIARSGRMTFTVHVTISKVPTYSHCARLAARASRSNFGKAIRNKWWVVDACIQLRLQQEE
jgi:hypothetical protein